MRHRQPSRLHAAALYALLLLAALPDGFAIPILKPLLVDRFGLQPESANWFLAASLIGAILAVPIIARARRHRSPAAILGVAAAINGIFLVIMMMTTSTTLLYLARIAEGAADLTVIAVLFDLVAKSGDEHKRGRRFGLAGSTVLISIALGLMLGGAIGKFEPTLAFGAGAICCATLAALACILGPSINHLVQLCPVASFNLDDAVRVGKRTLWPTMLMAISDRAVSGVLTAAMPTFLATTLGSDSAFSGRSLGMCMLIMAIGAWPAGWISDRIGHVQLRFVAMIGYGLGLVAIPLAVRSGSELNVLVNMIALGICGAALMPSALALVARTGKGSVAMGAYHSAGNLGFMIGVVGSGLVIAGAAAEIGATYQTLLIALGVVYLIVNTLACATLHRRDLRTKSRIAASLMATAGQTQPVHRDAATQSAPTPRAMHASALQSQ